jgi:uncharacterized protein (DUF305 family)
VRAEAVERCPRSNPLKAAFMSLMIPHYQGVIVMAQLAPDRAAHQELRNPAGQITSFQTTEISQMNAWLSAWYGL